MKCFEVTINGVKVCTAGIGDAGVLTSILSFVRRNPSAEAPEETFDIRVGGLAQREEGATEQVEWLYQNLAVGDEIVVRILEASACDVPSSTAVSSGECSFCNKKQDEVAKVIAGPAVFICNECVACCTAAIATSEPAGNITPIVDKTVEDNCSFCGKQPSEVAGIAGVPTAFICIECIKICGDILTADEDLSDSY